MNYFLLGCLCGLIGGVILGAKVAPDEIINEIGKIKGNGGQVSADQVHEAVKKENDKEKKKKKFLGGIFTKKDK